MDEDPRASQDQQNADTVFTRKYPDMAQDTRLVMARCLAFRETGPPYSFWRNPFSDGITFYTVVLARLVQMDEDEAEEHVSILLDVGALIGEQPHYDIVDRKSYYHLKMPWDRRKQIPQKIRQIVLSAGYCMHCSTKENLSVDHIIPVKMKGSDDLTNLQCLCRSCNSSKRDRFIG